MPQDDLARRQRMATEHFSKSHFELRWPSSLLRDELRALMVPEPRLGDVESLLREVLRFEDSLDEYRGLPDRSPSPWNALDSREADKQRFWVDKTEWLRDLWRNAGEMPRPEARPPYWSQRDTSGFRKKLDFGQTLRRFVDIVADLRSKGYLANALGQDCVDVPDGIEGEFGSEPILAIERMLDKQGIWPLETAWEHYAEDDLYDIIELIADIVARPRRHEYHSWDECGWHYSSFARDPGLKLYRHLVNELLGESTLGLTLGSNGRLERTATSALEPLVEQVRATREEEDAVTVATRQFRQRGAPDESKRQAIVSLAGVLEGRRSILKQSLLSKDEGALFRIANEFDLRHRKADQLRDYDTSLYFEWIFYWYLSTILLLDGILDRDEVDREVRDAPPF